MHIGSHIKPKRQSTRTVHIQGTPYVFAKTASGEFAADVANPEHADILLASRHFYQVKPGRPVLSRAVEKTEPPPLGDGTGKPADDAGFAPAIEAEASALLEGSASAISKGLGNVSTLSVVHCAIGQETAGKARKSVLALLNSTLDAAKQAGVTE